MKRVENVFVFAAYKPLLHIFSIFNLKKFRNQELCRSLCNICQAIAVSMITLAFIGALVFNTWYCMGKHFIVAQIALPFGILINSLQFAFTYISIRMRSGLVDEVIVGIGKIVKKRTYFFWLFLVWLWDFDGYFYWLIYIYRELILCCRLWAITWPASTLWEFGETICHVYINCHQRHRFCLCAFFRCLICSSCFISSLWISKTWTLDPNVGVFVSSNHLNATK